jgi:outer membrane murein-binding lipoprotein Lpp
MTRNTAAVALASMAALMLAGCSSNKTEETAATQVETTTTATEESTAATSSAAITEEYSLTEEARGELESVFKNCFYFEMGHGDPLIFSKLSDDDVEKILCTTFLSKDSYLKKGTYEEGTGYVVSREDLAEYLKDGFGTDLDAYDFSDPDGMLKDNGDTFYFLGGDYGMGVPDAIINTAVQDPEDGIITLTGDALFISEDDGAINPYLFIATMKQSDSKYFGGNTLISFEYEENTTGTYPEINPSDYGLKDYHFETK